MFYTIGLVMAAIEHERCYSNRLVGGFSVTHSIAARITMDLERLSVGSQIPRKKSRIGKLAVHRSSLGAAQPELLLL